jgi:hypothetical protein
MAGCCRWPFKYERTCDMKARANDSGTEGQSQPTIPVVASADEAPLLAKAAARAVTKAMHPEVTQRKRCGRAAADRRTRGGRAQTYGASA